MATKFLLNTTMIIQRPVERCYKFTHQTFFPNVEAPASIGTPPQQIYSAATLCAFKHFRFIFSPSPFIFYQAAKSNICGL